MAEVWAEARRVTASISAAGLTPEQVAEAQSSLTAYKQIMWRRYQHTRHLAVLDAELMEVEKYAATGGKQGNGRLLVMMPPRHGKTQTISKMFPAWYLGKHPDHRVILASYGASLSMKNSRYARAQLMMPRYQAVFPGVCLDTRSSSAEAWDIAGRDGGLDAMGVGGSVTGKGANILVFDDPHKNRAEAESQTLRDKVWDSWADDFFTRLEPGGAVVGVMTRWHLDDWMGRLLKAERDNWRVLKMPALAKEDDPLGRAVGEALWPERYPAERLLELKRMMHEYSFSALFDQEPVPSEGGLFKRASFNLIQHLPPVTRAVRFWDLAMSEKTSADYTVGTLMGMGEDGRTKVLDVRRRQMEWDNVPGFMAEVALEDGPEVPIGFEQKGYMSRAGQSLVADTRLHHYAIFGYPKDTDKFTNALAFAGRVGQGVVDVLDSGWTGDWLDEFCGFPLGAHDDQVDSAAGAYEMLGLDDWGMGALNRAEEPGIGWGDY